MITSLITCLYILTIFVAYFIISYYYNKNGKFTGSGEMEAMAIFWPVILVGLIIAAPFYYINKLTETLAKRNNYDKQKSNRSND